VKYLSVCAGIEASSVAWHHMGWEPVAFSEIEKFPSAVLAHHYPSVPNWGDMTRFQEWPDACRCVSNRQHELLGKTNRAFNGFGRKECSAIHSEQNSSSCGGNRSSNKGHICEVCNGTIVNVLVGGTPCQSFSVAGLRKGLDDPRGNLMLTYLAIAQRYRPQWLVWENVPGVLSSEGGRDFAALLRGLDELGYGWAYRVLDAQFFGVAQRRRRVFVVGHLGNWQRAAAVLFERHSLSGHPAPSRKTREGTASGAASGASAGGWPAEVSPTLNAHFGSKQGLEDQHIAGGGDCLSPTVAMCLITKTRLDSETETLIPTIGGGFDVAQSVAGTLGNRGLRSHTELDGHGAYIPVDIQGTVIGRSEHAGPQCSGADASGAMFTLTKTDVHAVAFPWQSALDPIGNPSDISGTLVKNQTMAVAFGNDIARSLTARHDSSPCADRGMDVVAVAFTTEQTPKASSDVAFTVTTGSPTGGGHPQCVETAMQVRRLTPVECERLQGFPDGYTNIPWRNKPESPDGPRYKALGNSMAVPVMRWIGERINEVSKL